MTISIQNTAIIVWFPYGLVRILYKNCTIIFHRAAKAQKTLDVLDVTFLIILYVIRTPEYDYITLFISYHLRPYGLNF
jgi:hypothetical protein